MPCPASNTIRISGSPARQCRAGDQPVHHVADLRRGHIGLIVIRAFLRLGEGAAQWLIEAGAAGAQRVRSKTARAVEFAAVVSAAEADRALGVDGD